MVRIESHLGRQIERNGKAARSLRKEIAKPVIAFSGRGEAGILTHRPEPVAIHFAVNPASVWKLSRLAEAAAHEREIRRARQKEVMPKYSISNVNPPANTNRSKAPALSS